MTCPMAKPLVLSVVGLASLLTLHCGSTVPKSLSEPDAAAFDSATPDAAVPLLDSAPPFTDAAPAVDATAPELPFAGALELPEDDPCRYVLAPLALALADGIAGFANTQRVTVSFTGSTFIRFYVVRVEGVQTHSYKLDLDNDSVSQCSFEALASDDAASLGSDTRSLATSSEIAIDSAIGAEPTDDACRSVSRYLAQGLSQANLIVWPLVKATVTRESQQPERTYKLSIDGTDFQANGQTFANDHAFRFTLGGDGKPECSVSTIAYARL
jgi:hypothetical protein